MRNKRKSVHHLCAIRGTHWQSPLLLMPHAGTALTNSVEFWFVHGTHEKCFGCRCNTSQYEWLAWPYAFHHYMCNTLLRRSSGHIPHGEYTIYIYISFFVAVGSFFTRSPSGGDGGGGGIVRIIARTSFRLLATYGALHDACITCTVMREREDDSHLIK